MKSFLLCSLILLGCAAEKPAKPPIEFSQNVTSETVHVGDTFTISVYINASAGREWDSPKVSDADVIAYTGAAYKGDPSPKDRPPMPGSGGTTTYTFVAKKTGTATVHFTYNWHGKPDPSQDIKPKFEVVP